MTKPLFRSVGRTLVAALTGAMLLQSCAEMSPSRGIEPAKKESPRALSAHYSQDEGVRQRDDATADAPVTTPSARPAGANKLEADPSTGTAASPQPAQVLAPAPKAGTTEAKLAEKKPQGDALGRGAGAIGGKKGLREEGGIQGGVVGGVVGGVLGGVVGGSAGGSIAANPMAPPPPAKPMPQMEPERRKAPPASSTPADGEADFDKNFASDAHGNRSGGDTFAHLKANPFIHTEKDRLSTFAVDVDTAAYTVARRNLNGGQLPNPDSVRVEEFVNYFRYHYAPPSKGAFSVDLEGAPSPFTPGHQLLKVGIQGKVLSKSQRKPLNLVFLVDTSGSMSSEDKLPLAREAIKLAVRNLNENDTVSLVTYAGSVRDVLGPTPAGQIQTINAAVDQLSSGGGTAMGSGMELAYKHAAERAGSGVNSRVVVLTDGDTNIGPHRGADSMLEAVAKHVQEGVTLSTIGFGMGNYRDDLMERLADKGNGNCFYIDSMKEARKVFEQQLAGMLEVIAKDVKIQVEFNPEAVASYRLVGYENRDIADADFRNDKVDAGEIGAGHTVTALYEVQLTKAAAGDLATVRIRAKEPNGSVAKEQTFAFGREFVHSALAQATADFRFATAVAGTADILRHSAASEAWSLATAEKLAQGAQDGSPERAEFVRLVQRASAIWAAQRGVARAE